MNSKIRVVLVDDHNVILDGLIALLSHEPKIQVTSKALSGEKLMDVLATKDVDVIVMDVDMPPGLDGVKMTEIVKEKYPDIKILIMTQYSQRNLISHAIEKGADGYILKTTDRKTLVEAIIAVSQGELYTKGITLPNKNKASDLPVLTEREKEIIKLIVAEKTSSEIASTMYLSVNTINHYRKSIMHKLGVKSLVGIVNYAHRNNLVD